MTCVEAESYFIDEQDFSYLNRRQVTQSYLHHYWDLFFNCFDSCWAIAQLSLLMRKVILTLSSLFRGLLLSGRSLTNERNLSLSVILNSFLWVEQVLSPRKQIIDLGLMALGLRHRHSILIWSSLSLMCTNGLLSWLLSWVGGNDYIRVFYNEIVVVSEVELYSLVVILGGSVILFRQVALDLLLSRLCVFHIKYYYTLYSYNIPIIASNNSNYFN